VKRFELTDLEPPVDTLDGVLDVAAEVLAEYGGERSDSRIERMARWIAANVGGEPYQMTETSGAMAKAVMPRCAIWRVGEQFGFEAKDTEIILHMAETPAEARAVAVAILRAVDLAEA
jgi:hypothetical protein